MNLLARIMLHLPRLIVAAAALTIFGAPAAILTQTRTTAASVAAGGTWSNAANAASINGTCALGDGSSSTSLTLTNWSFAIPAGATILGVTVRSVSSFNDASTQDQIRLVKAGVASGTAKVLNGGGSPSIPSCGNPVGGASGLTVGGAADLWGTTLAVADVNATGFGVFYDNDFSNTAVDGVEITVAYNDNITVFNVVIEGGQEVPPNAATGSGSGTVTVNPGDNSLTYSLTFSGLTGSLTGAHFHGPAPRGVNAAVKINITGAPNSGAVTYLEADEAAILGGQWYVNFHTAVFPGGEIRAQLDNLGGVPKTLTVNRVGNGVVSSTPAGISCGATCAASFAHGTSVTLNAVPDAGSTFSGWSGACGGTAACIVTMTAARSVTATFTAAPVALPGGTDLNGDGYSDILYRNASTGQVSRLLMIGLGFANGSAAYSEANTAWKIVADADFNGDGITDILYRNDATGAVYSIPFNAGGLPGGGALVMTEPNLAWKIVHAPDIDGDGRADILYWNSSTGQVYAMLMNGAAIGTQGFVYTEANTAWKIVAVGDFAGSGKRNQLLWHNAVTGQVYLMTVTVSGGVFSQTGQMIYTEANTAWKILGAADFNGDGKSDIVWRNGTTGAVYMMLMNGGTIASQGVVYTEGNTAWKIVAQGDYDGDGRADLLWRNDATGQVYMMLMNGLAIGAQGPVFTEPDTAWKVLGPTEYGVASGVL